MFKCVVCGEESNPLKTIFKPRDRRSLDIVDCPLCSHRQLYPLLSEEELEEEYAEDKTVRSSSVVIAPGSDFEAMKKKFSEWTKIHADLYWDILQEHSKVLNLGSGYGFLEEELNKRPGRKFVIEGDEIGRFRLEHYVGGVVHTVNFAKDTIPSEMQNKYDLILGLHLLEHLNNPVAYLRNLKEVLAPGGALIIEVPNINAYLCELSPEYAEFFYLYEHVSYFSEKTLREAFSRAGYIDLKLYSRELYSVENHINWIRNGKPFIAYNQMYLPDKRIEFINEEYKRAVSDMGKGYALICEAKV